jgi:F-type H+-transporting ATPase subunit delta
MIEIVLGDRYAKSILQLAKEKGVVPQVKADFDLIASVCRNNPDFVVMLRSPLIYADKKQEVINSIFKGKLSVMTSTLIEIIVRKKREKYLLDIAICFLALHDKETNTTRGVLTTAFALTPEMRASIKALVEKDLKTEFNCVEVIDPSLIGGFVLRIGDYQYDGSISSALKTLRNDFDSNPYIKEY